MKEQSSDQASNESAGDPIEPRRHAEDELPCPFYEFQSLSGGCHCIYVGLNGERYELRQTRNGKLVLHK